MAEEIINNKLIFADIGQFTDKGKMREINEDSYALYVPPDAGISKSPPEGAGEDKSLEEHPWMINGMLVISDGLGGHVAGETASKLVTTNFQEFITNAANKIEDEEFGPLIAHRIKMIHEMISDMSQQDPSYHGMGATIVTAILKKNQVFISNVGDSRAYLIRNGAIYLLSEDDNALTKLILEKKISEEEAKLSPFRSQLTQAIGITKEVDAHIQFFEAYEGDIILLCSDGLTEYINDKEIKTIIENNPSCQVAVDALGQMANDRGGRDNITTLTARIGTAQSPMPQIIKKSPFLSKILLIAGILFAVILLGATLGLFPYISALVSGGQKPSSIKTPVPTISPSIFILSASDKQAQTPGSLTSLVKKTSLITFDYNDKSKELNIKAFPKWIPLEVNGNLYNTEPEVISLKTLKKSFKSEIKWVRFETNNKEVNIFFDEERYLYIDNKKAQPIGSDLKKYSITLQKNKLLRVGFYLKTNFPVIIPDLLLVKE